MLGPLRGPRLGEGDSRWWPFAASCHAAKRAPVAGAGGGTFVFVERGCPRKAGSRLKGYMDAPGILFVSHDASRTGAPIALLHFLRWFKRNGNRPFSVLLGDGGELVADFAELADTRSMVRSRWYPGRLRTRLLTAAGFGKLVERADAADARRFAARCSPALVYVN